MKLTTAGPGRAKAALLQHLEKWLVQFLHLSGLVKKSGLARLEKASWQEGDPQQQQHDIEFVCLPQNAKNKLQSLMAVSLHQ
jgi:hypothetical protein